MLKENQPDSCAAANATAQAEHGEFDAGSAAMTHTSESAQKLFVSRLQYLGADIAITADGTGLRQICFSAGSQEKQLEENYFTVLAKKQLLEYFAGWRKTFDMPYTMQGTPFQQAVWQALARIPYGATATYGAIAQEIGRPKAFRAVGLACNKNPLPLIIPCHRVIGQNGSLTGYAGGLHMKQALLELERRQQ